MLTATLAFLLAVLPGAVLGFVVPAGRHRWAVWAATPVLTLGLTSVGMAWLPVVGLPSNVRWVLGAEIALAGAAVATSRLITRHQTAVGGLMGAETSSKARAAVDIDLGAFAKAQDHQQTPAENCPRANGAARDSAGRAGPLPRSWRPLTRSGAAGSHLGDILTLSVPAAVTVGFGQLMVGRFAQPPGWDGMNHALLTRNILATGSTAMTSACSTGSTHAMVACHFYPLAADVSWAQAAALSGGRISTAMTTWSVLVGPLFLVVAVYACVRALGGRPVVAACAAAAPTVLGPLWTSMLTGRITEEVGPGLSIGVALLAALALHGRYPIRLGLLAGLGAAGLLLTHTYDVLFAVVLALALALVLPGRVALRDAARGLGATVLAGVLAIGPFGTALLGANGERKASPPAFVGDLGQALRYWLTDLERYVLLGYPAPGGGVFQQRVPAIQVALVITVLCLLASPLCVVFKRLRWGRPWLAAGIVWTIIGIWTSTSDSGPAMLLSSTWYGVAERVRTMMLPVYGVLAVSGACAIGLSLHAGVAKLVGRDRELRLAGRSAAVAAVVVAVTLLGLAATPSARLPLRLDLARRAPHGPAYPRVFQWLSQHTPRGEVVAYDRHLEFMTWSYGDYGVPLLFGIPPVVPQSKPDYFSGRFAAWDWLVDNPGAEPADCLVRHYGIAYVVIGMARVPGWHAHYSRKRLAASPRVRVVHQDGDLKVYEVKNLGMACPTS